MNLSKKETFFILFILMLPMLAYLCFVPIAPALENITNLFTSATKKVYTKNFVYTAGATANTIGKSGIEFTPKKLEHPPDAVKAIYLTGWSAGSKNYSRYLDDLFKTTQINAVVIDIKDASGIVSYKTNAKKAKEYKAYWPEIGDMKVLIENLHRQGIYVIGRIAVFEDPMLAKNRPDLAVYNTSKTENLSSPVLWQDNNGLSWMDPSSPEVWDYNISIAKDAIKQGFDEINFDYIRFPTDGKANEMGFPVWDKTVPKNFVIKSFFKKLRSSLPDTKISADLFGQTTINTDDMGIGQIFEDALSYFDYVAPMVYPSHYANGFLGYKNPAEHPFEIVKDAMNNGLARKKVHVKLQSALSPTTTPVIAKIRPWLQDFDLRAVYDEKMVRQQIQATVESLGSEYAGYMLWSPSNVYTKEALIKEEATTSTELSE